MAALTNPDLEARILADPTREPSSFLVYGDWLSERGDPRGELVAVQAKLLDAPDDPALRAAEAKLLAANAKTWLGPFADKGPKDVAFGWRLGFLDTFRLGPPVDDYETSDLDFAEALESFMALPGIRFVRSIVIGGKSYDDYPTSWQDAIDALAEHGVPDGLARLEFNRGGYWDISSTELGDLSPLYPRLGGLEELVIEMGALELGSIALPALRSLEIVTGGLKAANVASIVSGALPALERLSLCIGETDNDYGCDVSLEHLAPIFAGTSFAKVRHLGLCNASFSDDIAEALVRAPILRQLETLDLSRGTFGDRGARCMLDNASAFRHLKRIDLTHHYVSEAVAAELAKLGPEVVLADAQQADEDGDDEYRYVSISE